MLERGQFAFPAIFKPPESGRDTTLFRLNAARLFTCVPPCPGRFDGPRYEAIRNSLANFVFAHCAASIVSYFLDSTNFSLLELRKGSFIQQFRIFGQCLPWFQQGCKTLLPPQFGFGRVQMFQRNLKFLFIRTIKISKFASFYRAIHSSFVYGKLFVTSSEDETLPGVWCLLFYTVL